MSDDCYCDFEPADVYRSAIRTARKPYRCEECAGHILPGEKYENVFMVYRCYGDVSTVRTCERCYDIRMFVKNNVPCYCVMHGGDFKNDALEAVSEARHRAPEETKGILFGTLRRFVLRDRFNDQRRIAA